MLNSVVAIFFYRNISCMDLEKIALLSYSPEKKRKFPVWPPFYFLFFVWPSITSCSEISSTAHGAPPAVGSTSPDPAMHVPVLSMEAMLLVKALTPSARPARTPWISPRYRTLCPN